MRHTPELASTESRPTRIGAAAFRFKSFLLQIRRSITNALDRKTRRNILDSALVDMPVLAESRSRLWSETDERERSLVAGKIQNLRVAVARLDGIEVGAGETFSFWRNVGRANRRRGFVAGRELREGCIIPTIGGGLCQLSNALYDGALKADLEIVERHPHTRIVPGSLAVEGRDATVFWNYLDLRFRSAQPFRIEASLTGDHLSVRFRGQRNTGARLHGITRAASTNGAVAAHINSCTTCGVAECFRSMTDERPERFGRTAFLVDEFTPEFDRYITSVKTGDDDLFVPVNGARFRRANYAWTTSGFAQVRQSLWLTAVRSYRSRRLAAQGAARQRHQLAMYERLAEDLGRKLRYDSLHVVVQQNLLPFLWRKGHLGGRTFDVLMTALPMSEIQSRLDVAAALHPASRTLGDFRADRALVAAETDALAAARRIITPHREIASLYDERAELLEWDRPAVERVERNGSQKPTVVFPASTVGRKGCYELREALSDLDVRILTLGPYIEAADFWNGHDVARGGHQWFAHADLVVLPAFVEHRPRRLLRAAAAGIPVIASAACGVSRVDGITTVEAGDAKALRHAIVSCLGNVGNAAAKSN